jgi:Tol biopolymer transport system component
VRRVAALLCALGLAGLATLPAEGTAPGTNGQIVYARFPTLWVVKSDGSGARKLPWVKGSEASNPDWSPDGRRIAFDRCAVKCEIWTIDADGSGQKRVGPDCLRKAGACEDRITPAWSPDGRRIAFGGNIGAVRANAVEQAEIFVMNANGGDVRRVTRVTDGKEPFSLDVRGPAWSPDGKQLVFEVENLKNADPPNRRALYIVNADGSGLRQLTPWSLNAGDNPDWSPDGKLILFRTVSISNRHHGNLHTIRPDGTGLRRLTSYPAPKTVLSPTFSPDGRWIAFSRFTDGPYPAVYVMRADGTDVRRVTRDAAIYELDWGPAPR